MDPEKEMDEKVLSSTAIAFGVTIDDIRSKSRKREIADARKAIVYIMKKDLKKKPGRIAKLVNKKHCTMNYMLVNAELLIKSDSEFRSRIGRIRMSTGLDSSPCPCCGRPYEASGIKLSTPSQEKQIKPKFA